MIPTGMCPECGQINCGGRCENPPDGRFAPKPEPVCSGCPGPQPGLDCEFCDESEGAKEERRAAVRARGGN